MADIYEALAKRQNGTTVDYTDLDANQLSSLLARPTGSQRSEAQLRQAAENRFASLYNQKNLAAQQQYETTENAINNQLAALADAYTAQREQTQKDTAASLSWADRNALMRGMGRSSYNLANMTNIRNAGDKALQATYTAETNERNALNNNLSLAKQQLGQLLAAYAVDRETDILAHMDELRDKDYTRALQELQYRNELEMMLANYGLSAKKAGGSSGGGNDTSDTSAPGPSQNNTNVNDSGFMDNLKNAFSGVATGLHDVNEDRIRAYSAAAVSYTKQAKETQEKIDSILGKEKLTAVDKAKLDKLNLQLDRAKLAASSPSAARTLDIYNTSINPIRAQAYDPTSRGREALAIVSGGLNPYGAAYLEALRNGVGEEYLATLDKENAKKALSLKK